MTWGENPTIQGAFIGVNALKSVPQRFHLDSIDRPDGTTWYTLVFESPSSYFVEQYNDSKIAFIKDRIRKILPDEFHKCSVNGVVLSKLVDRQMKEILAAAKFRSRSMEANRLEIKESAA